MFLPNFLEKLKKNPFFSFFFRKNLSSII